MGVAPLTRDRAPGILARSISDKQCAAHPGADHLVARPTSNGWLSGRARSGHRGVAPDPPGGSPLIDPASQARGSDPMRQQCCQVDGDLQLRPFPLRSWAADRGRASAAPARRAHRRAAGPVSRVLRPDRSGRDCTAASTDSPVSGSSKPSSRPSSGSADREIPRLNCVPSRPRLRRQRHLMADPGARIGQPKRISLTRDGQQVVFNKPPSPGRPASASWTRLGLAPQRADARSLPTLTRPRSPAARPTGARAQPDAGHSRRQPHLLAQAGCGGPRT
jgi:hypothetical protein